MRMLFLALAAAAAALTAVPMAAATGGGGTPSGAVAFSGEAWAVNGETLGVEVDIAHAGPIPASGGTDEADGACLPACGAEGIEIDVAHALVVAQGNQSHAEASAAFVVLGLGEAGAVSASGVSAVADAECIGGRPVVSGGVAIESLVVGGEVFTGPFLPGQTFSLGGGSFVRVNDTDSSVSGSAGEITVTAITVHVEDIGIPGFPTGTDLTVGRAHADIVCGGTQPPQHCPKKGSGKGHSKVNGMRVDFAFGAIEGAQPWGHVLYNHKALGLSVRGLPATTTITAKPGSPTDSTIKLEGPVTNLLGGLPVGWFEATALDEAAGDSFGFVLLTAPRSAGGIVLYSTNGVRQVEAGDVLTWQ
jgi:hypothetical protein